MQCLCPEQIVFSFKKKCFSLIALMIVRIATTNDYVALKKVVIFAQVL